ncbi:hypothetical protein [Neobacillus notoginsengisoli]|uniref:hypothetical protein n=1 Tax=Neobacillus notoginsengisoli TaxID=1578198 RepID=UPI00115E7B99|nr:hypothetical protein [Neobacillus notoginsengisoli]
MPRWRKKPNKVLIEGVRMSGRFFVCCSESLSQTGPCASTNPLALARIAVLRVIQSVFKRDFGANRSHARHSICFYTRLWRESPPYAPFNQLLHETLTRIAVLRAIQSVFKRDFDANHSLARHSILF